MSSKDDVAAQLKALTAAIEKQNSRIDVLEKKISKQGCALRFVFLLIFFLFLAILHPSRMLNFIRLSSRPLSFLPPALFWRLHDSSRFSQFRFMSYICAKWVMMIGVAQGFPRCWLLLWLSLSSLWLFNIPKPSCHWKWKPWRSSLTYDEYTFSFCLQRDVTSIFTQLNTVDSSQCHPLTLYRYGVYKNYSGPLARDCSISQEELFVAANKMFPSPDNNISRVLSMTGATPHYQFQFLLKLSFSCCYNLLLCFCDILSIYL